MTKQEKIDRVIRWLTTEHLWQHGGYPFRYIIHAGKLFVAGLDDAKDRQRTEINVYDVNDLDLWYDRAAADVRENYEEDAHDWPREDHTAADFHEWSEAFRDTAQEASPCES